jgi:putative membrane protein
MCLVQRLGLQPSLTPCLFQYLLLYRHLFSYALGYWHTSLNFCLDLLLRLFSFLYLFFSVAFSSVNFFPVNFLSVTFFDGPSFSVPSYSGRSFSIPSFSVSSLSVHSRFFNRLALVCDVCFTCGVTFIRYLRFAAATLLLATPSVTVLAHNPLTSTGSNQYAALLSLLLLMGFCAIYLLGARRRAPKRRGFILFFIAALLCALAVLGPLDDWAKTSTAAHMTQHMVFIVVIGPLWVLSRPLAQLVAGGGRIMAWLWRPMLRLVNHPMITAYLHGFMIWFWHMPVFYMLAVRNPWWHALEHLCFLSTAGWFWWAVLNGRRKQSPGALLALLFTLMHTGFLGAILTFARAPWYGEARSLADQQLAGLIMWVAGALPYLLASVWVGYHWYLHLQRRMDNHSVTLGIKP